MVHWLALAGSIAMAAQLARLHGKRLDAAACRATDRHGLQEYRRESEPVRFLDAAEQIEAAVRAHPERLTAAEFKRDLDALCPSCAICRAFHPAEPRRHSGFWDTFKQVDAWCSCLAKQTQGGDKVRFVSPASPPDQDDILRRAAILQDWA